MDGRGTAGARRRFAGTVPVSLSSVASGSRRGNRARPRARCSWAKRSLISSHLIYPHCGTATGAPPHRGASQPARPRHRARASAASTARPPLPRGGLRPARRAARVLRVFAFLRRGSRETRDTEKNEHPQDPRLTATASDGKYREVREVSAAASRPPGRPDITAASRCEASSSLAEKGLVMLSAAPGSDPPVPVPALAPAARDLDPDRAAGAGRATYSRGCDSLNLFGEGLAHDLDGKHREGKHREVSTAASRFEALTS